MLYLRICTTKMSRNDEDNNDDKSNDNKSGTSLSDRFEEKELRKRIALFKKSWSNK